MYMYILHVCLPTPPSPLAVRDEKSLRLILDLMSLSNTSGQEDKVGRGKGGRGNGGVCVVVFLCPVQCLFLEIIV